MKWIEISVICKRAATDEVTALFYDLTDNGSIEEAMDSVSCKLTLYFDEGLDFDALMNIIRTRLDDAHIEYGNLSGRIIDESTWYNSWQQYIRPTEILPGVVIKPAWKKYDADIDQKIIEIDSDLSFGTGAHETTRCCAKLLAECMGMNDIPVETLHVLDIGTGTGILLLVASVLGATHLTGIDVDPDAAEQARINCRTNGVDANIICGDLDRDFHDKAHIIIANLTVDPLKRLLPVIGNKLAPRGALIISGIIDERYDEIMPYIMNDWSIVKEMTDGSWHTFCLGYLR